VAQTLVDILEQVTDATTNAIVAQARSVDKAVGDRPFGQKYVPERAQVRRYTMIRNDQEAWKKLISDHGLGPVLDYAMRQEKLLERYPDEDLQDLHDKMGMLTENQSAPVPPDATAPVPVSSPTPTQAPAPSPVAPPTPLQ
jgi:hypothetical protein